MVEAFKKIIFAKNSTVCRLMVSITRTPLAFCVTSSKIISVTVEKGRNVRFPVFNAAGIVELLLLK